MINSGHELVAESSPNPYSGWRSEAEDRRPTRRLRRVTLHPELFFVRATNSLVDERTPNFLVYKAAGATLEICRPSFHPASRRTPAPSRSAQSRADRGRPPMSEDEVEFRSRIVIGMLIALISVTAVGFAAIVAVPLRQWSSCAASAAGRPRAAQCSGPRQHRYQRIQQRSCSSSELEA